LVEQRTENPRVGSSILPLATNLPFLMNYRVVEDREVVQYSKTAIALLAAALLASWA
jgi:hypothetical protein